MNVSRKIRLAALALAVAVPVGPIAARSDDAPAQAEPAAFRELDPIALRAPVEGAEAEQWEMRPTEGRGVRNVVNPTLTPVLPLEDTSNGLAVIVAPGGGFISLAFDNEGMRVARHLAERGITAFVLKYRLRQTPRGEQEYRAFQSQMMSGGSTPGKGITTPPEAVEDALAAVQMVRDNAGDWGVDPAKVGMIGFSAGAMTALGAGVSPDKAARPDFIAPIYGSRDPGPIPADAPPMFLAIALDDPLFRFETTMELIEEWRATGQPMEVHLYEKGGHGFGMRPRTAATGLWTDQFIAWMKDRGLMMDAAERRAYSIRSMKLGAMLENPAMRAVLEKHLPGLVSGAGSQMAGNLSLAELLPFAGQAFTREAMDQAIAELIALP